MKSSTLRTWIEIDKKALRHNVGEFFRIISPVTKLMAVIKSNAYGHGLTLVAKQLALFSSVRHAEAKLKHLSDGQDRDLSSHQMGLKMTGKKIWFGVDSIVEALRLRREGITNPILVLGFTLPSRMEDAAREHISISISNFPALNAVSKMAHQPAIHLKLDTGMHRQGFLDRDIGRLITIIKKKRVIPEGIFTHFASAKDACYPTYTLTQLDCFNQALAHMKAAGFSDMIRHSAATGGTLLFPDAHLDMVRIGMGLYGYWPSEEAKSEKRKVQNRDKKMQITLKPILTWKTIISETKRIPKGAFVGYDLTERVYRATTIAVVPIGYWHGYDRGFSSQGYMLVHGHRARVLGRVSMDMTVIDVTDIPSARLGDEVVVIGTQGRETVNAEDLGRTIGTSAYEALTRINPLIKRIII